MAKDPKPEQDEPSMSAEELALVLKGDEGTIALVSARHTAHRLKAQLDREKHERKQQQTRERKAKRPARRSLKVVK
jgi:hypothetical protein